MHNFVFGLDYWNSVAKTNHLTKICSGYNKEEDFWAHQPDIQGWGLKKSMAFLDLGCGPGRIVKTIAPLVKEYYGVDHCRDLISTAKLHHQDYDNVQFFVNDGCTLDCFSDSIFDFVLEYLVFIHCQKDFIVGYINEIHRVLKPGGILLVKSLPKKEHYVNGFCFEEMKKAFNTFKEAAVRNNDIGKCYYIRCVK